MSFSGSGAATSPDKELRALVGTKISMAISHLCSKWDLQLEVPEDGDLPNKLPPLQRDCVSKITFLCWKDKMVPCLAKFDTDANELYSKWVKKPHGERGVVPAATRKTRRPVTDKEREQLLQRLYSVLDEETVKTPKRSADSRSFPGHGVNDSPVPFVIGPGANVRTKRPSHDFANVETSTKKLKQPIADRGCQLAQDTRSANTSSTSMSSTIFSAQTNGTSMLVGTQETVPDDECELTTQPNARPSLVRTEENHQSPENNEGNSLEARLNYSMDMNCFPVGNEISSADADDGLSRDLNQIVIEPIKVEKTEIESVKVRDRLKNVFPLLPPAFKFVPFQAIYEITRVFLHAEVPMDGLDLPINVKMNDYDSLWCFLKGLPVLKGKPFPERCGKEVWVAASQGFKRGHQAVQFGGSLCYNRSNPTHPFFRFRLRPMRLDLSHRLERRFGSDRFLVIDIPPLTGRETPKVLQNLGEAGPQLLIDWLVDDVHGMLGREWKPFHTKERKEKKERKERKEKEERRKKKNESGQSEEDFVAAYRVYFFAVTGDGFQTVPNPHRDPKYFHKHFNLSIPKLLDSIRPTTKNMNEKFLKLFARTDLAVSRTSATLVFEKSQIIYEDDILCNGEVMTDGAGRISPIAAHKVSQVLGLSYTPSGFQGRIGEAKGFWSVDLNDQSGRVWIRVYESQLKWVPSSNEVGEEGQRTFEVVKFSNRLKPADLHLQLLPLLTERANDPNDMRKALSTLLEEGLQQKLQELKMAMDDPKSFRHWLRESSSGINDRLKSGCVTYRAGMPVMSEERIVMMLDAGFDPKKLHYLNDLAHHAFKQKTKDLKEKLNVTVSRSTIAFMVPDFAGVLEPDEVYLDFSSFQVSGLSGVLLNGMDVLVARSPAHYISDIQKVRAVSKVELMGLKDVIVFPTKGNPSLAAKLSGGDYDGDTAWVCWEPTIVDNFNTADVAEPPDLVKKGFIHKNSTTYMDLVEGKPNPTSVFLKESFKFNLKQDMLGICTNFKESVCYTQESVDTPESLYMSALLSLLVDQAKQGYTFTQDDFVRFKREVIKLKTKPPSYKTRLDRHSKHIIDQLMCLAEDTTEQALVNLHKSIPVPPMWDNDLVIFYNWARGQGEREPEWKALLDQLDKDINAIKTEWGNYWRNSFSRRTQSEEEIKGNFMIPVDQCYPLFQEIRPHVDTPLTQSLLPTCLPDQELSPWALLRASALFKSYRNNIRPFVWFMAGKQLAQLKAIYSGGGFPPAVTTGMYAMLKPDGAYVKRARLEVGGDGGDGSAFEVDGGFSLVNEDDSAGDDSADVDIADFDIADFDIADLEITDLDIADFNN